MATIVIPKELSRNQELVAVPRNLYEEFLAWQDKVKSIKTFKPTKTDKKFLARARKNRLEGDFLTLDELKQKLGLTD